MSYGSVLLLRNFVTEISSAAYSRNLVAVTSFVSTKNLVTEMSSATYSRISYTDF